MNKTDNKLIKSVNRSPKYHTIEFFTLSSNYLTKSVAIEIDFLIVILFLPNIIVVKIQYSSLIIAYCIKLFLK